MLNPRVDFVFKKIFGSEENKDILMSFINSVVSAEDQVVDLTLRNPFSSKSYLQGKLVILDIRAVDVSGRHYNIEMQITDQLHYEKRALYYWSDMYAKQLNEGATYSELKKTIGIHVLNFNLMDETDFHNRYYVTNHASKKRAFQDLELHTIELGKFEREMGEVRTTLERWAAFLTKAYTLKEGDSSETTQNPEFQKAMHVLETLSLDDDERLVYDGQLRWLRDEEAGLEKSFYEGKIEGKIEGHLEGLLEGELKGELKGKLEGKLEIAREMAAAGIDPEMIRRMTGLSDW